MFKRKLRIYEGFSQQRITPTANKAVTMDSTKDKPLRLAVIGCGSRGYTYSILAARMPDKYELVAGADPMPERRERMRALTDNPEFRTFETADELLAQPRMAD